MEACANCGNAFDSAYCPACGQKRMAPGMRIGDVLHDFAAGVYNVDAPIPNTLRTFVRGPAGLTRAFLAGRRKAFTPPVRYFLFGIAYYYIMRWLLNWDPVDNAVHAVGGQSIPDNAAMRVNHWMSANVNLLLPLLLIILATFDRLLFPRTTLNWVERLIHYLFAVGTYLMVATTLLPLNVIWPLMNIVNFLVIMGTLVWATISLHRTGAWTVLKAVLMVPLCFVLYVFSCMVLVALVLREPLAEVFSRH
ncbi:MAG: DUF3667 domain-containing protein [Flavobacteriales bacterium]|nr:DUF3667 domain-containing protein [Flavobacteriales bacterium]